MVHGRGEDGSWHEVLYVSYPPQPGPSLMGSCSSGGSTAWAVGLAPAQFAEMHPIHIAFDSQLCVVQCGAALARMLPQLVPGVHLVDMFEVGPWAGLPAFPCLALLGRHVLQPWAIMTTI